MPEHPDPDEDLADLRIYEGDELIFDYDDPTTYIVLETPEDVARFFAELLEQ